MQEIEGVQNRYQERTEEHERRMTQVIGSEARDALRGYRSHMSQKHRVGEREKKKTVLQKTDALGATVTHCKLSKILI